MGPICVTSELAPFLPGHPDLDTGREQAIRAVSAAPWGSSSSLLVSWAYIALLGRDGVRGATEAAILNAGLKVGTVREQHTGVGVGEVYAQDPAAGSTVVPLSTVDIWVSLGFDIP